MGEIEAAEESGLDRADDASMALKFCPNGECVNFQIEVETDITRCRMCAWEMQPVKKQSETVKEDSANQKRSA